MRKTLSYVGAVVGALFSLPFIAVGIGSTWLTYQSLTGQNEVPWYFTALFAVVFTSVGFIVLVRSLRAPSETASALQDEVTHAARPWRLVKEFRSNRISDTTPRGIFPLWLFAGFWNLFIGVLFVFLWDEISGQMLEDPKVLLILLFPIVGVGLLVAAIRSSIRRMRFGSTCLELDSMPVYVGSSLKGTVELPLILQGADHLTMRLTCYRVSRSSKSTSYTPLWQDEQKFPATSLVPGPHGLRLPVSIAIPPSAEPMRFGSSPGSISWQLDVTASVPGVDFSASYPVPVVSAAPIVEDRSGIDLIVEQIGKAIDGRPLEPRPVESYAPSRVDRSPSTTMTMSADGRYEWNFPPFRLPLVSLFLAAFMTGWWSLVIFVLPDAESTLFMVVFGVLGALLTWAWYDMTLVRWSVKANSESLEVSSGPLITLRTRTFPVSSVKDFSVRAGASVGSKTYQDILIRLENGKNVRVGSYVRTLREAESIVHEMKQAMGRGRV